MGCDRLHKGLCVTHRMLGISPTDTDHAVISLMSEVQEICQSPTQTRRVELPPLNELPDKTGLDPIMPPATGWLGGSKSHLDQGRYRRMEAGIIGTPRTAVGASIRQFTLRPS